ncbi:MAG: STAS domain-containing protein [Leptospiraceae bacterium]|nr:STAS domain-containing protein [Leptospiraceae bacterium]MCP5499381.1 STAS domain-containing protein [Leptospiraceae bacterium]
MEIKSRKIGNSFIIELIGSLDIYTAIELRKFIEKNVSDKVKSVVLDMEKLKYIDSSGIGMLIKEMNFIKQKNGNFAIANLKPHIEKVFNVAGLNSYFTILSENEFKKLG